MARATTYVAEIDGREIGRRSTSTMGYSHCTAAQLADGRWAAQTWHTRQDLAARSAGDLGARLGAMRVVVVEARALPAKVVDPARAASAQKAANTRKLTSGREYLARMEQYQASWKAERSEQELARLIRDFGEARGRELHRKRDEEVGTNVISAQVRVELMEAGRFDVSWLELKSLIDARKPSVVEG